MDRRSAPTWEQERRTPARAHGTKGGGGALDPSTVKGECDLVPQKKISEVFALLPHVGAGSALKSASSGLGGGADSFFSVLNCVDRMLKSVNVCLQCLVSMHWGRQRAGPNHLPDARPGGAPKGASPGLGGGADLLFLCRIVLPKC